MRKNNTNRLSLTIFLALLLVAGSGILFHSKTLQVIAQEEVESTLEESAKNESTSSATTSSLKERIEKVVEEKETQNGSVAGQVDYSTRAIVGLVERVSESAITIQSLSGSVIVPITEDVELTDGKKAIKIGEVEIENSIIAMGLQAGESFTPIKIIVSTDQILPRPQVVTIGAVKEVSASSLSVESRIEGSLLEFSINKNTEIIDSDDDETTIQELFEDVQVVVAGYSQGEDDSQKIIAQIVKALVSLD